jgi:phage/plasmid-like protein (TIGR03299 family)
MAHNIMERNGVYSMFCVVDRDAAWHKLGQRTPNAVEWREAMRLAGLEWSVVKRNLYDADGKSLPAFGIFRQDDNAFLGSVGERYTPIQNISAFKFVDELLEATDGSHYDSAGALGNGERIWVAAKVPFDFEPVAGDKTQTYLLFTTSHDGSVSATGKLSTVRVVCQNTLSSALSGKGETIRVKHTRNAADRMQSAIDAMRGVGSSVESLRNKLTQLAQVKVTRESLTGILDRLFPKPKDEKANTTRRENILADVLKLYESNDRNAFPSIRGTGYNLLNAVTEYTDHVRSAKGADQTAARAASAMFGSGDSLKTEALQVILEQTANGPTVARSTFVPTVPSNGSLLDAVIAQSGR